MSMLTLVIIEIALCLAISLSLIVLIKPFLRDMLIETCGTQKRAEFWVMFTQIMLVIAPLLLVIYFIPTSIPATVDIADELKNSLFRALLGDFIALATIGQVIWRSIQKNPVAAQAPAAASAES